MAELIPAELPPAQSKPIPASAQLLAVAWLRWRMFVNSTFRKRSSAKLQAVNLFFVILVRVIVWPFMALMIVGPVGASGFLAWVTTKNHPQTLQTLLAGIAVLWQFVSINGLSIAATVSNFDPASLTRFPLRFGRYFLLRTLIGLLTPSTIVGCLSLLAAAVGIGIARPALALPATVVLLVYALMNIFLTRMIGAWMERWLANRRFREIFSVLMALFAVSLQLLNFQRLPAHAHAATNSWLLNFLQASGSSMRWLPPGLAYHAIVGVSHPVAALAQFGGLIAVTALFAAVFAIRLHKQFLGELLSENEGRRASPKHIARAKIAVLHPAVSTMPAAPQLTRTGFSPTVTACLRKEWLTFRGNSAQLVGLITPLIFIAIFNRGQFATHPWFFLPGAIAYVLLGVLASLYNVFGADGLGVQVYLLAPIRMRDVIIAKNISSLTLIFTEAVLAWMLVSMLRRTEIPLPTYVSTALWTIFVIAVNLALGTLRSIQAPRRFVPGQARYRRGTPTNRTSGLLILLVLFGSLFLQVPITFLSRYMHLPWLAAWIFGPLAAAAITAYALLLHNAESLILSHRDVFAEELCKA